MSSSGISESLSAGRGGVTAWYVAFAHATNATFDRELVPTWPLK